MKPGRALIPLLLGTLLVLAASQTVEAYSGYFYVVPFQVALRECASPECDVLLTAYRGDKVEILARTSTGWSRVRLVDKTGIGWMPSDLLSYSPDLRSTAPPHYYVNTNNLALRAHPTPQASVLAYLHFNEPVEMLGTTSGYAQVRELKNSKVGFVLPRYLSQTPVKVRRSPRRRAPKPPKPPSAM
jgi:uncharacterized protein YgiM (DUF1202 family)